MTAQLPGDHTVTIEFDKVGMTPTLRFHCHAAADAECRNMCPQPECEEGCREAAEVHPRESLNYCNNVEWFNNGDDVETWVYGGTTSVTVPVEVSWQGSDDPEWRFVEQPSNDEGLFQ